MSALGQKRTSKHARVMSALPPKADITEYCGHVRFVPKADSCTAAKKAHLYRAAKQKPVPVYHFASFSGSPTQAVLLARVLRGAFLRVLIKN